MQFLLDRSNQRFIPVAFTEPQREYGDLNQVCQWGQATVCFSFHYPRYYIFDSIYMYCFLYLYKNSAGIVEKKVSATY